MRGLAATRHDWPLMTDIRTLETDVVVVGAGPAGSSAAAWLSRRFALPRPMLGRAGCDFSFSGLKTAVAQLVARYPVDGVHLDLVRYPGQDYSHDALSEVLWDDAAYPDYADWQREMVVEAVQVEENKLDEMEDLEVEVVLILIIYQKQEFLRLQQI